MKVLLLIIFSACTAYAQPDRFRAENQVGGSIITRFSVSADTARVMKLDSGNLANQQVKLFNLQTKASQISYTDQEGKYLFNHVEPGNYYLFVEDQNAKTYVLFLKVYAPKSGFSTVKPLMIDRIEKQIRVLK